MQTTLDYYLRASGATDQKQKRAILLQLAMILRLPLRKRTSIFNRKKIPFRDAGTTGVAGASAPHAFCIHNFLDAVRVQTMDATGAQKIYSE